MRVHSMNYSLCRNYIIKTEKAMVLQQFFIWCYSTRNSKNVNNRKYTWSYMLNYFPICNIVVRGLSFNAKKMEPDASLNVHGQKLNKLLVRIHKNIN